MSELESTIDNAWETRAALTPQNASAAVRDAVAQVITGLDSGRLRVAAKSKDRAKMQTALADGNTANSHANTLAKTLGMNACSK